MTRRALLLLSLMLAAGTAQAEPDVRFADFTWTEIAGAVSHGTDTIIIPVGGTEQSGPYLAVGKHDFRAEIQADRIAQALGHAMVAPVIAYVPEGGTSPRTSHMRFPGTISIPPDVFRGLVTGAAESFHVQGFRTVVFLADHGGYIRQLEAATDALNRAWRGTGARALYVAPYYDVVYGAFADRVRGMGLGADIGTHADLIDTALTMALKPDAVRSRELASAPLPGPRDGVYGGDPRAATARIGTIGADMQVNAAIAAIRAARGH